MTTLTILILACVIDGACHAVKDTLHFHWSRSVFRKKGFYSFFGPAEFVWMRRYKDNNPATKERRWSPMFDGIMDAWHLAESLRFGVWVLAGVLIAGYPIYYGIGLWFIGQLVFTILYDYALLKNGK